MPKKLNQYAGPLTPAQVAAGINAARANAQRLAADAWLLLDAKRYPSAAGLAVLAIEEAGKVHILRAIALARNASELRDAWRDYRTHTKKNVAWQVPFLGAFGRVRKLDDFRPLYDEHADHPHVLDQLKQVGLYTDCLNDDAYWSTPDAAIDESTARLLVGSAHSLAEAGRVVSTEDMELWIQYLKPVWKGPMEGMKKALVEWYRAAAARGLVNCPPEDMERFVFGPGFDPPTDEDVTDQEPPSSKEPSRR